MKKDIIFGIHAVLSLIQRQPSRIEGLFLSEGRADKKIQMMIEQALEKNIKIKRVSKKILDEYALNQNHQGAVAQCRPAKSYSEEDLPSILESAAPPILLLVLDTVQDPHNLGACLRTADAAKVAAVIAPKDKSVGLTPTVIKVASGASDTVPFIQVTNLARTLRFLKEKNIWLFGADSNGERSLYQTDLTVPLAWVMGAEGQGLRCLTREHCDGLFHVPMLGSVQSLNVSVAAGVFLFETVRQRGLFFRGE